MRKVYIFFAVSTLTLFALYSKGQETSANVATPKGSTVTAWTIVEDNNTLRNYYDALYATSGRTYLYYFPGEQSSSRRFNCHGYAWHMAEGGAPRWIGWFANTEEDIYMTDGSYVQVCSEIYPGKVSWPSADDHSAITTPTPGRWISKWGRAPWLEHDWNDNPYGTSGLKYYASTSISGSTAALCSGTRNFSVINISGASYTWYVNSNLTIVSGQGTNTVTVQRNGSSSGNASVYVEISTPCSGGTVT